MRGRCYTQPNSWPWNIHCRIAPGADKVLIEVKKIMPNSPAPETVEHPAEASAGELITPESGVTDAVFPWSDGVPGAFPGIVVRNGPMQHNTELLGAQDDLQAVAMWLRSVSDYSQSTYRAYRKEVERLLLWASSVAGRSLSELTRGDYIAYLDFIRNPRPAESWIMDRRYPRADKRWRPFMGPLTPQSARYAQGVIYGMLEWLKDAQWLQANLMPSVRRRRTTSTKNPPKSLTPFQCELVQQAIERRPQETPVEQAHYERLRWMFEFFRGMAARASEAAESPMSSFQLESTGSGTVLSWKVFGKGRVAGIDDADAIPVRPKVRRALQRFRQYFGLPPYPAHSEATPVIPSFARMSEDGSIDLESTNPLTESGIYKTLDALFHEAAQIAHSQGHDQDAEILRHRSTHSLRHTAIREFVDETKDLALTQRFARHNEISTTMLYASQHYDALEKALTRIDAEES